MPRAGKAQAHGDITVEPGVTAPPTRPSYPRPTRRSLRLFALDPQVSRLRANQVTVQVPYEPLLPGPIGTHIQVLDVDAPHRSFYEPVDLDHPFVLAADGITPNETDPRFHQQMTYAVAMLVIDTFSRALGRPIRFKRGRPLTIVPHAFVGANAYYDPERVALLFGYFTADPDDPGPNLPGQTVYTCLSHDIIAHETTHAVVDRLRPRLLDPTNRDVYAFHEGFSDIVAIFQHVGLRELLATWIAESNADLGTATDFVSLATQFGYATGSGTALRSAIDTPDPTSYRRYDEPHDLGAVLVAAVFDAFFRTSQTRIADLLRLSGAAPAGAQGAHLHPDLVGRIADEVARNARRFLMMCVRAFDFLPPLDVTFSDFLRAAVTADAQLYPTDESGLRAALIEGFRRRGIHPVAVGALGEANLAWENRSDLGLMPPLEAEVLLDPVRDTSDERAMSRQAVALQRWATEHAAALGLVDELPVALGGFHATYRIDEHGRPRFNAVAQFTQHHVDLEQQLTAELGGVPLYGGTTLVIGESGVRHVIAKPVPGIGPEGQARLEQLRDFIRATDARLAVHDWEHRPDRMRAAFSFRMLHQQ